MSLINTIQTEALIYFEPANITPLIYIVIELTPESDATASFDV